MNQGWTYCEQVKPANAGQTVLEYYTQRYRHSSQQQWQTRIESGQVLLNSQPVGVATILKPKDRLTYHRSPWVEPEVPLEYKVLYEDRDLLLINKPSGLPVMPGGGFLEHTLLWQLKKDYPHNPPVPVHRLGRGTSGLLLLGRSTLAKSHLAKQMRDSTLKQNSSQISKVYRALVAGSSLAKHLTIDRPIGKVSHPILGYIYGATAVGMSAHSECRVIERYAKSSLVEVKITTGRPHQIRIHLAAAGYPLLGDPLYLKGGTVKIANSAASKIPVPGDCGYFLHAYAIDLIQPRTLEVMSFQCPVPWTKPETQLPNFTGI